jgi:putative phosphonate metabolism protein
MDTRYAIYYTPPRESPLGRFAIAWFGWDHYLGQPAEPLATRVLTRDQHLEVTASPRRYGFHATLKAPFRLAAGQDESALCEALEDFAGSQAPVTIPGLFVASLNGFLALVPAQVPPELPDLADAFVAQLDHFRAPDPEDLARRRAAGLTPRQQALLDAWGYPYVLEEWRFHMTLTDTLQDGVREAVLEELLPWVEIFARRPLRIDSIALFRQPSRETPFTVLRLFPLKGALP